MAQSFSEIINGETPVLVDFHAEWCGPCKMMAPVIQEIAADMKGKLKVIKVDTDKNQQASMQYQIQGVPTFILFKEGKVLWRQSGAMPKNQLQGIISQYVK